MTIRPLRRIFEYAGVRFPDLNEAMSVEQVRGILATQYPEIATASLTGPETVGDKSVYRFERAIGTKG
ncbi:MAG: PRTRC system protein C [Bryobacteraceae bacterium]